MLGKNEQNEVEPLFLLTANDNIAGTLVVKYKGKKVEHLGIKIELIGQIGQSKAVSRSLARVRSLLSPYPFALTHFRSHIALHMPRLPPCRRACAEFMHDSGNPHEFTSLVRDLEDAGEITADKSYNFEFNNVEKNYETYNGNNVRLRFVQAPEKETTRGAARLGATPSCFGCSVVSHPPPRCCFLHSLCPLSRRYFLRARVSRQYASNITKVMDLAVQNLQVEPEVNNSIKMEVGIEDWSVNAAGKGRGADRGDATHR